ncbi:MAG: COP9 signalosome (CSN) subunit [Heterodermia speciosa]|uniref:COP9 signalosome (CSN) subunit n=1 Tax=Heterodermia speciosa TaxID=116794 RepID=A0A8H3FIF2_9LECA|nr:MAG: COP9 signalosome (CSN) subunit [Heterodermia speciosa]
MDALFHDFKQAHYIRNGPLLADTLSPIALPRDPNRLRVFHSQSDDYSIASDVKYQVLHYDKSIDITKAEANAWVDIYIAYWKSLGPILDAENVPLEADWSKIYDRWKDVANSLIKGYSSGNFPSWTVPCLYVVGRHLRIFAIKADESARVASGGVQMKTGGFQDDIASDIGKNEKLEDAARVINRIFTLCISDRASLEESRKWALYYTTNLLFKTYFKLNSISLSKNILRALSASRTDMPVLEAFPKSHIVTFKYYVGVIFFLEEDYKQAEESLTEAYKLCHAYSHKNRELILTYLIPTRLLTTRLLPSVSLLRPYPRLLTLFMPLVRAIRLGSLHDFDAALSAGEPEFVKRRIYLTLERGRDICLRNLLRKVCLHQGWKDDGQMRKVSVSEFVAAVGYSERGGRPLGNGEYLDRDEVECQLANMIYKDLMKGYISREHSVVVLSKKGAFPGTGI